MNYLAIKQVLALTGKSGASVIINAVKRGHLNAIRPGHEWLIANDDKLKDYIANPPPPGVRPKEKSE